MLGNEVASYALYKYNPAYTGFCVRVRRSSDSTEQNIGFGTDGLLNSSALITFLAGSNGFVTTWYDQSGSFNLVQATAGSQPQLVWDAGRWVVYATGGRFLNCATFIGTQTSSTVSTVWRAPINFPSGLNTAQPGMEFSTNCRLSPGATNYQGVTYNADAVFQLAAHVSSDDGSWRQHSLVSSGGSSTLYEFGAKASDTEAIAAPTFTSLTVGKNTAANGDLYIAEIIFTNSVVTKANLGLQFTSTYPSFLPYRKVLNMVIGDSISTAVFCGLAQSWQRSAFPAARATKWFGFVKSGWQIGQADSYFEDINWYLQNVPHQTSNIIMCIGTNNISFSGPQTGADVYALYTALIQRLKTAGWKTCIGATILPCFQSGTAFNLHHEPRRIAFNNLLIADVTGLLAYKVNFGDDALIGAPAAQDNTTYYSSDFVHPIAAGTAKMGALIGQKLLFTEGTNTMAITNFPNISGVASSSAGGAGVPTVVITAADYTSTQSVGIKATITEFGFTLQPNKKYLCKFFLNIFAAGTTANLRIQPDWPADIVSAYCRAGGITSSGSGMINQPPVNGDQIAIVIAASNTNERWLAEVTIQMTGGATGGNFLFKVLGNNATTPTEVKAGSTGFIWTVG